jgi:hypothetical protein
MIETWNFAGRTFSIIEPTAGDDTWMLLVDGVLLMDRKGEKPNRLKIHTAAFGLPASSQRKRKGSREVWYW